MELTHRCYSRLRTWSARSSQPVCHARLPAVTADLRHAVLCCRLHFDESALAEKKNVAIVSTNIDPSCMNMELPNAALFSMDDPAKPKGDPKLAPGGVLEVAMDENMLAAEQQNHANMKTTNDWDGLRRSIVGELNIDNMSRPMNDDVKAGDVDCKRVPTAALHNLAVKTGADSDKLLKNASGNDVQSSPKGNVVPFKRQRAPRM